MNMTSGLKRALASGLSRRRKHFFWTSGLAKRSLGCSKKVHDRINEAYGQETQTASEWPIDFGIFRGLAFGDVNRIEVIIEYTLLHGGRRCSASTNPFSDGQVQMGFNIHMIV